VSTSATPGSSTLVHSGSEGRSLIIGATGAIGSALVEELLAGNAPLRVMCRRPEQVRAFRERGVDAAQGSLDDSESLRMALRGCEQLFLNTPPGLQQYEQNRLAIDAAVEAGGPHVVKISASDANPESAIPWARDHARADEYLRRSGLPWTVLKPGAFFSNLLTEAAAIRRGWLPQTSGHGATAWVDTADVAAVAARVLTDPEVQGQAGAEGRTYLLTEDRPRSYPEIAGILTATLGHRVRYVHLPAPVFYAGLRASGVQRWQAKGLVHQFVDVVRRGQDGGRLCSSDIPNLLGRPAASIADFVKGRRAELSTA
jgi:uncharacterized protein YbjT (DUF2867 family)